MSLAGRRLRVAVVKSNFWPEQTGIGQITSELAKFLSDSGIAVTVVTGMPYYPQWKIYSGYGGRAYHSERFGDVEVRRSWHYCRPNPGTLARIVHEASLSLLALPALLRTLSATDVALVISPDLTFAFVGTRVARVLGVPVVLNVQDVMPDAAVELGMLTDGAPLRLARALARSLYESAVRIYTLSEGMRARICAATLLADDKTFILPNTIDVGEFAPREDTGKPFRDEFVTKSVFAVVHTGNMGEKQDLDVLLRAARTLVRKPDIHFFVFGDGAVRGRFEQKCAEWELTNVSLLPFQPREMLPHMLNGADAVLVSQRAEVVDIVVPSKLVTAMAAGAMIVATCPEASDTANILRESGGGVVVPSGDDQALVATLLNIKNGAVDTVQHRERVRKYAHARFSRDAAYTPLVQFLKAYKHQMVNI